MHGIKTPIALTPVAFVITTPPVTPKVTLSVPATPGCFHEHNSLETIHDHSGIDPADPLSGLRNAAAFNFVPESASDEIIRTPSHRGLNFKSCAGLEHSAEVSASIQRTATKTMNGEPLGPGDVVVGGKQHGHHAHFSSFISPLKPPTVVKEAHVVSRSIPRISLSHDGGAPSALKVQSVTLGGAPMMQPPMVAKAAPGFLPTASITPFQAPGISHRPFGSLMNLPPQLPATLNPGSTGSGQFRFITPFTGFPAINTNPQLSPAPPAYSINVVPPTNNQQPQQK